MKNKAVGRTRISVAVAVALGAGFFGAASNALAQQAGEVQRVEITGSSIKRVLEEQALPVQVISREEIGKSGAVNIEQLMQSLPSVNTASSITKSMGAGLSTYGVSTVSLRGIGDNRSLVLINGRRAAPFGLDSAAVDINSIPMQMIERIEVLTDGASSIYGSDAIGGVINFITRQDFQGIEASVEFGQPTRSGGGDTDKYSVVAGFGSLSKDKYNFTFAAGLDTQTKLKALDRSYAASGNVPPYFSNGATGGGNIEGVWIPGTIRSANVRTAANPLGIVSNGQWGNPLWEAQQCNFDGHFYAGDASQAPSTSHRCFFDSAPYVNLIPKSRKENFSASFTVRLNPNVDFYGSGSWVYNSTLLAYQPSPVRSSFLVTDNAFAGSGVDPALLIRPTNPNYPKAWLNAVGLGAMDGQVLAVTQRAFIAGPRTQYDTSTQTRFIVGAKGNVAGWDFDTAFTRDESQVQGAVVDGYFSQLALARAVNVTTDNWNPWAPGGVQPDNVAAEVAKAKYVGATAGGKFARTGLDGRVSKPIAKMAGGDVNVSVGVDIHKEVYDVTSPPILESGDIAGLGGGVSPQHSTRDVKSVFGEINVPVLKNLEFNGSVRSDSYSDLSKSKNPTTGKLSVRFTPVKPLVLRGSVGTGFRAPSLAELYQPETLGTSEQFDDVVAGIDYQANAKNGGNKDLEPEKSKQWSLGGVLTPMKDLSLRLDYWNIEIEKYVTSATAQALVDQARAGCGLCGGQVTPFVTFAPDGTPDVIDQRAINAGIAKFSGFDIGLAWSRKFNFGQLGVDYNATRMTKAELTTPDGKEDGVGTQVDANGSALKLVGSGGVILKYKHKLTLNWALGDWSASLTQNHFSSYRDGNDLNDNPHKVPAYSIYDIQAQYKGLLKGLNLVLGVKNVFDKDPPLFINSTNFFQYGFDPTLYDPLGRFVYVRATYKF